MEVSGESTPCRKLIRRHLLCIAQTSAQNVAWYLLVLWNALWGGAELPSLLQIRKYTLFSLASRGTHQSDQKPTKDYSIIS